MYSPQLAQKIADAIATTVSEHMNAARDHALAVMSDRVFVLSSNGDEDHGSGCGELRTQTALAAYQKTAMALGCDSVPVSALPLVVVPTGASMDAEGNPNQAMYIFPAPVKDQATVENSQTVMSALPFVSAPTVRVALVQEDMNPVATTSLVHDKRSLFKPSAGGAVFNGAIAHAAVNPAGNVADDNVMYLAPGSNTTIQTSDSKMAIVAASCLQEQMQDSRLKLSSSETAVLSVTSVPSSREYNELLFATLVNATENATSALGQCHTLWDQTSVLGDDDFAKNLVMYVNFVNVPVSIPSPAYFANAKIAQWLESNKVTGACLVVPRGYINGSHGDILKNLQKTVSASTALPPVYSMVLKAIQEDVDTCAAMAIVETDGKQYQLLRSRDTKTSSVPLASTNLVGLFPSNVSSGPAFVPKTSVVWCKKGNKNDFVPGAVCTEKAPCSFKELNTSVLDAVAHEQLFPSIDSAVVIHNNHTPVEQRFIDYVQSVAKA